MVSPDRKKPSNSMHSAKLSRSSSHAISSGILRGWDLPGQYVRHRA